MRVSCLALLCTAFYLAPASAQTAEQQKATIAYLRGCQEADGGFVPARSGVIPKGGTQSSLRATSAALRALKYFGGEPRDRTACARFVERCFDKTSGGFADHPRGEPGVVSTAVGIMALAELKLPVSDYRDASVSYLTKHVQSFEDIRIAAAGFEAMGARPAAADAWLKQIAKLRRADGTYGTADGGTRDTGSAVVAILRLGDTVEHRDSIVRTLKNGQRPDGGFGKEDVPTSDLETCYRVLRAFVMLKEKPDVERCLSFIAKCRNSDGGYGVAPGQASSVGSTYFAATILHWLK
jgi:prenyltransferase beta subunit